MTLKFMYLDIWFVLKVKFPKKLDIVSGTLIEMSNSLTNRSFWNSFRHSNLSMPIKWPQSIVFIWFILILLVESLPNTRLFSIRLKIPLLFVFLSSRKRPQFYAGFLALKSILLIIIDFLCIISVAIFLPNK